jgi:hypothetical protein
MKKPKTIPAREPAAPSAAKSTIQIGPTRAPPGSRLKGPKK